MDISQMRMMLVLADCKSMTTTAKKLHVTQPALTYRLKAIESELGFKVFNRSRTGTSLTAEGAYFCESARDIVSEYDETVRLARAMAKGAATNLAMEVLQPHIAVEDEKLVAGAAAIGTVVGDIHDVGKNLVRIMLESRDIKVTDLGTQVPAEAFVEHVRNNPDCNLILISVNRTELVEEVRGVIAALEKAKLRDQLFVMVGGSAVDAGLADEIGADAYTKSAEDAADTAWGLLSL